MKNKNKKKSPLDAFRLWTEKDKFPKKYISPTAGQKAAPSLIKKTSIKVVGFGKDVIEAIKELIKEVS